MSAITPPPPVGSGTSVAAPNGLVQVSNPPRALTQLPIESVIKGDVIALQGDGRAAVVLRTPVGPLTLQGSLQLPLGATVTLSLQSVGTTTQMLVLTVNGRPFLPGRGALPAMLPQGARPGAPAAQAGAQAATQAGAQAGAQGAARGGPGAPGRPLPLTPGTTIQAVLGRAAAASAAGGQPASAATAQLRLGGLTIQRGEAVTARVVSVSGAGPQAAAQTAGTAAGQPAGMAAANAARLVSGTVVASSGQGQPVLQTPVGSFYLPAGTQAPPGTRVTLELLGTGTRGGSGAGSASSSGQPAPAHSAGTPETAAPQAARTAALATQDAALQSYGTRRWGAMTEALAVLRAADPVLAQTVIQSALPQANVQLTASAMFFLTALRGGDLRGWLGDSAVRALERAGRGDLAGRLGDEFGQLSRASSEPVGDWRMLFMPFYNQQEVEQLRLFWRRGSDEDGEAGKGDTRFIIDVELSRMGHLQLDGLVRSKRIDLIVRSGQALPAVDRRRINEVFAKACEGAGLAGNLSFQANGAFVEVAPPQRRSGDAGGVVV